MRLTSLVLSLIFLLSFSSCARIPTITTEVSISDIQKQPPRHRSTADVFRLDLETEEAQDSIEEVQQPTRERGALAAAPAEEESLEEILLLEIQASRGENLIEIVQTMTRYASSRRNSEIAARAYELALGLYNTNYAKQAAAAWYEIDPRSSEAQEKYLRILLIDNDYERALEVVNDRLRQNRDVDFDVIARYYQVIDEVQTRNLINSYNLFITRYPERARELEEANHILRYKLAFFLFYNQEADKSLQLLNLILVSSRDNTLIRQATELKGRLYYISERPNSESFFRTSIRGYRNSFPLNIHYGLYLIDQGRANEGEQHIIDFALRQTLEGNNALRLTVIGAGAAEEGLMNLHRTIQSKIANLPNSDRKNLLLGILDYVLGSEAGQRTEFLLSQIDISSELSIDALKLRFNNYVRNENYEQGLILLDEIFSYNRGLFLSFAIRFATALSEKGERRLANRVIRDILSKMPDDKSAHESAAFAYYNIGDLRNMNRQFNLALRKSGPEEHAIRNSFGYSLTDKDIEQQKAKELIDEAIRLNPTSAAYVDSLGWWFFRNGQLQEARYHLAWALRASQDAEIAAHYGEVLWYLGQTSRAKYIWSVNSETSPGNKVLLDTMARFNLDVNYLRRDNKFFNTGILE